MTRRKLTAASAAYGILGLLIYFVIRFSCGMPGATEQCDALAETQSNWFGMAAILFYLVLAYFAPREPE